MHSQSGRFKAPRCDMEARKRGETTQYVTDEDAGKRKAARNRDGQ